MIVVIDEFTYLTKIDKGFESMLQNLIGEYKNKTTFNLVKFALKYKVPKFIFSSSATVYGD